MLELLSRYHHFPSRAEDCLVTLFLPKLNVKRAVRKLSPNHSSFPLSLPNAHEADLPAFSLVCKSSSLCRTSSKERTSAGNISLIWT